MNRYNFNELDNLNIEQLESIGIDYILDSYNDTIEYNNLFIIDSDYMSLLTYEEQNNLNF